MVRQSGMDATTLATGLISRLPAQLTLIAGGIGLAFWIDAAIFTAVVVPIVIIAPFEKLYPRKNGQRLRRPLVMTDISFAVLGQLLNVAAIIALVIIGGLSFL